MFLSFLIIALSLVSAEHNNLNYLPSTGLFFGLFFLSLGFLVSTVIVKPTNTSTTAATAYAHSYTEANVESKAFYVLVIGEVS